MNPSAEVHTVVISDDRGGKLLHITIIPDVSSDEHEVAISIKLVHKDLVPAIKALRLRVPTTAEGSISWRQPTRGRTADIIDGLRDQFQGVIGLAPALWCYRLRSGEHDDLRIVDDGELIVTILDHTNWLTTAELEIFAWTLTQHGVVRTAEVSGGDIVVTLHEGRDRTTAFNNIAALTPR